MRQIAELLQAMVNYINDNIHYDNKWAGQQLLPQSLHTPKYKSCTGLCHVLVNMGSLQLITKREAMYISMYIHDHRPERLTEGVTSSPWSWDLYLAEPRLLWLKEQIKDPTRIGGSDEAEC